MRFAQPIALSILLSLGLLGWLDVRLEKWRKKTLAEFADDYFQRGLFPNYLKKFGRLKRLLGYLAITLLIFALARPQSDPQIKTNLIRKLTFYYVLDESLSMQARDILPNRLAAAHRVLDKLIDQMPGDRMGIIIFAGQARVLCPATYDHVALKMSIPSQGYEPRLSPGSNLTAGLQLALDKLSQTPGEGKRIILLSDGEEIRSGQMETLSLQAAQQKIEIYCVGMGTSAGARIPVGRDFLGREQYRTYQGQIVKSKLDSIHLMSAAQLSGGEYLLFTNPEQTAKKILSRLRQIQPALKKPGQGWEYRESYYPLTVLAWLLILAEMIIMPTSTRWS